ncbi:MAG: MOSC domain-containing protein [Candidatus Eisenbacteria bacterium]
MTLGTISQLWRYPVKSMGGERIQAAPISLRGIPGDRGWAVFDETRAGITTGKRVNVLRQCSARYLTEPVAGEAPPAAQLTLPDGTSLASTSPEAARRLSEAAGRPLSMRCLGPAGTEAAPRVSSASDSPDEVRALMGILPGETEPDYSMFTAESLRALRLGNFFDAYPLHLLSDTTLRTLKGITPECDWDERRFRANIVFASAERTGYPEHAWEGKHLRIGEARLEVVMGCPRCVMVTLAESGLPADPRIMRTLVRETEHIAGVYVRVTQPGAVRVGDAIELA